MPLLKTGFFGGGLRAKGSLFVLRAHPTRGLKTARTCFHERVLPIQLACGILLTERLMRIKCALRVVEVEALVCVCLRVLFKEKSIISNCVLLPVSWRAVYYESLIYVDGSLGWQVPFGSYVYARYDCDHSYSYHHSLT
ncbi:hypothetical protein CDAR_491441 [Caerostris darwini]|uniref:Uncharacterized protein n=1 Tax=Caerostris darwini TaxID=1538125 RepID=A0AAV4X6T3_9ARAC|nr:hypothetical protein CDAR_491441 [Caerostris darwini]